MRKELLLAVAFEEFAQSGYHTTLSQIGKRAGIKKQTIYNYFQNKDDLLYEVIAQEINTFYAAKTRELDRLMGLTPEEILKTIFFSICNYFKDTSKVRFWRWIFMIESTDLFEKSRDLIRENEKNFYISLKKVVRREMLECDAEGKDIFAAVQVFAASIQGIMDLMLLYRDMYDSQTLIENMWDFYWKSIRCNLSDE